MKKIYQIEFSWKTPKGKRVTHSTSAIVFEDYGEALDYAIALYNHSKRLSEEYKNRNRKLICDYCIRHLIVNSDCNLNIGGDLGRYY